MKKFAIALAALLICSPAFAGTIKLSSTIGPVDAGIIPLLAETFKAKTGTEFVIEKAGTGATLEKAKGGDFDMVVVHARALEDKFIAEGYGQNRRDIMYNDFVILGPKDDPAGIKGMKSAAEAFGRGNHARRRKGRLVHGILARQARQRPHDGVHEPPRSLHADGPRHLPHEEE